MTLLAPLWFALAGVAALSVVALHLITTQQPPPAPFPTARFVPEGEARATARATRPADLVLLATRVAALLLLGLVAARPASRSGGGSTARVVVVDRSRSSGDGVRDAALAAWRPGDALVLFDSSARGVGAGTADSLRAFANVAARGALSPALVAAVRAARAVAPHADSVELVLISPVAVDELDAATSSLAAQWRGRVRVVRTPLAAVTVPDITLTSNDAGDALRPTIGALNAAAASSPASSAATSAASRARGGAVRVVREAPTTADSAAARAGTALVHWPTTGDRAVRAAAVWALDATLVAPLADLGAGRPVPQGSRVVARWADGTPAAVETALGSGCLRSVMVGVPIAGDVTLQPAFLAVARRLLGPCDNASTSVAASDSVVRALEHDPAGWVRNVAAADQPAPIAPWLAALALLLLLAELKVRRSAVPQP